MKTMFMCILSLVVFRAVAQEQKTDTYSFVKLYVTDDKGDVLLVKWEGQWEIAGNRYNEPVSVRKFGKKWPPRWASR